MTRSGSRPPISSGSCRRHCARLPPLAQQLRPPAVQGIQPAFRGGRRCGPAWEPRSPGPDDPRGPHRSHHDASRGGSPIPTQTTGPTSPTSPTGARPTLTAPPATSTSNTATTPAPPLLQRLHRWQWRSAQRLKSARLPADVRQEPDPTGRALLVPHRLPAARQHPGPQRGAQIRGRQVHTGPGDQSQWLDHHLHPDHTTAAGAQAQLAARAPRAVRPAAAGLRPRGQHQPGRTTCRPRSSPNPGGHGGRARAPAVGRAHSRIAENTIRRSAVTDG